MARPWNYQRGYNFIDSVGAGTPYVELIAEFESGETLTRSRLDLDARGAVASPTGDTPFPDGMYGSQMVAALAFDQDASLPVGPGGFFGYTADWIWVQQVSFANGPIWADTESSSYLATQYNTASSQVIDSHAQRAVIPGNVGGLWLVLDIMKWGGPESYSLTPYVTYTSYVGSKLPA